MIEIPLPEGDTARILAVLAPYLNIENGPWVAGGAARRMVYDESHGYYDIDVFFRDDRQLSDLAKNMRSALDGAKYNGYPILNYVTNVQFVHKIYFPDLNALLDDFDFTVCQFASDGKRILARPKALSDLNEKRLAFTGSGKIKNSTRISRYLSYGFEPTPEVMKSLEAKETGEFYQVCTSLGAFDTVTATTLDSRSEDSILAKLTDCHIHDEWVYINGAPFPPQLAIIVAGGDSGVRDHAVTYMENFWYRNGFAKPCLDNVKRENIFSKIREEMYE